MPVLTIHITPIVPMINDETKFILASLQIDNLKSLLKGNEYETFLYSHLIPIQVELNRQLTNLKHSSKIQESNTN
jgi:hypothetical protein